MEPWRYGIVSNRQVDLTGPIRNQGENGSCYAEAAVGALNIHANRVCANVKAKDFFHIAIVLELGEIKMPRSTSRLVKIITEWSLLWFANANIDNIF